MAAEEQLSTRWAKKVSAARALLAPKVMMGATKTKYRGPERRVHRVYVTHNTEYHVRAGICVAVRDRASGAWADRHPALGKKLDSGIIDGDLQRGFHVQPEIGDAILFHGPKTDVVTSKVERVTRPPRAIVAGYPSA